MTFFQLAPFFRGMIAWIFLAVFMLDVFLLLVQWQCGIPGRLRQLVSGAVVLFALYQLLQVNQSLSMGEVPSGWVCNVPVVCLLALLLVSLAQVGYAGAKTLRWQQKHITLHSLKEGMDCLPTALCFYQHSGLPLLTNHTMNRVVAHLTGAPLRNGAELWRMIAEKGPILRLDDGSVWSFRHDTLQIGRRGIQRITAVDVTREYRLTQELREKNRQIRQMNERLLAYGKTVEESTREQEILETKVWIHDQLGKVLLASRRSLNANAAERAQVLEGWKRAVALFDCQEDTPPENAPLLKLIDAARSIGVTIKMEGAFPAFGTRAAKCMISAAHECLTNAVRHADATELCIHGARAGQRWVLQYTNNGRAPTADIHEGGGLSSLRRQVENAGGSMTLCQAPQFTLTLSICDEKAEKEEAVWPIA